MPWPRLTMRVVRSYSSAPAPTHSAFCPHRFERDIPKGVEKLKMHIEVFRNKQKNRTQNMKRRHDGLFHLFGKCACGNIIFFFKPVRTRKYHMEQSKTFIMALNFEITLSSRAHAQFQICTLQRHIWRYQIKEITWTQISMYRNCY